MRTGSGDRRLQPPSEARFLSEKVFGPYRLALLDTSQETLAEAARHEQASKAGALRRAIADTDVKSRRLIRSLELADDLDQDFIRDIKERRAELRANRTDLERQLAAAQEQARQTDNPPCSTTCQSRLSTSTACPTRQPAGCSKHSGSKSAMTPPAASPGAASP